MRKGIFLSSKIFFGSHSLFLFFVAAQTRMRTSDCQTDRSAATSDFKTLFLNDLEFWIHVLHRQLICRELSSKSKAYDYSSRHLYAT